MVLGTCDLRAARSAASRARRRLRSERDSGVRPWAIRAALRAAISCWTRACLSLAAGLLFAAALLLGALLPALLLASFVGADLLGLGLPALGGGVQQAGGVGPVGVGDGTHGLAVEVVAAVAAMVEQGQQIAVPTRVVGQRPA